MPLFIAQSGFGKSFITRRFPTGVIDGDDVIHGSIGWPKGEFWKSNHPGLKAYHIAQSDAIITAAQFFDDAFIFFNLLDEYANWQHYKHIVYVGEATLEDYKNNMGRRSEGSGLGQPTDPEASFEAQKSQISRLKGSLGENRVRTLNQAGAISMLSGKRSNDELPLVNTQDCIHLANESFNKQPPSIKEATEAFILSTEQRL
jgi:hypothetical protein